MYTTLSAGKFNGNIAEIDWKNSTEDILKRYNYEYDPLNRLKNGFYAEPNAVTPQNGNFDEYLSYDINGNITHLQRKAFPIFGLTSTVVDALDYAYTGNRLTRITENALNNTGYEGGNNQIDYDQNGNMTTMKDKGIQNIAYNHLNLPNNYYISQNNPFDNTVTNFNLNYLYRADGVKVRKTFSSGGGKGQSTSHQYTDYLEGFQYSFSETLQPCAWCRTSVVYEQEAFLDPVILDPPPISLGWQLDFMFTAEGFYSFKENRYIYQYKDHLGNARVNFVKNSAGVPEITDTNDYYPFGLNHIGGVKAELGSHKNYKYNGKELQETGMYDYGARMYMPDIGRWGVVDPLAEKMPSWSPYVYTFNNPVNFVDPDGREPDDWVKRTGMSGWEFRSDIHSKAEATKAGYVSYSNGRGDKNSIYYTTLSTNGVGTGVNQRIVLGENGNYTNNGKRYSSPDTAPYISSKDADDLGKALAAPLFIPAFIMGGSTAAGSVAGNYLRGAATRGIADLSTQAFFKGADNIDGRQLLINTFVGGGNSFQSMGKLALTNLTLNTANNFGTSYFGGQGSSDAAMNTTKIFTGALGNAAGIVGGNTFTSTVLPSIHMNGTDKVLNNANDRFKKNSPVKE